MNKLLAAATAAALMCTSAAALSQDMTHGTTQNQCMQMQMKMMGANSNGMISKDSYMKAQEAMWDKMPKNSDGMVSMKDMQMHMMRMHQQCGMMKNDKMMNNDKMMDNGMQGH